MKRYFKLYLFFIKFSASKLMEFRLDFAFRIFMDVIFAFINIFFFKILFLHTNTLGGLTEPQIMVFVATHLFIDALIMTFLANNIWFLPHYINRGDLDYYVTRPVSPQFFLFFRDISVSSFINLILNIGILIWALSLNTNYELPNIFKYVFLFINGVTLYFCFRMLFILPVFWVQSSRGFDEAFYNLEVVAERPDTIFKGFTKKIFSSIIPMAIIASYPTRALFGKLENWELINAFGVTLFFFILMQLMWRAGLKSYTSASS